MEDVVEGLWYHRDCDKEKLYRKLDKLRAELGISGGLIFNKESAYFINLEERTFQYIWETLYCKKFL